jgi:hypothetical protein
MLLLEGREYRDEVLHQAVRAGWRLLRVPAVAPPHPSTYDRFRDQFAKLYLLNLTRCDEVVCMDSDAVFVDGKFDLDVEVPVKRAHITFEGKARAASVNKNAFFERQADCTRSAEHPESPRLHNIRYVQQLCCIHRNRRQFLFQPAAIFWIRPGVVRPRRTQIPVTDPSFGVGHLGSVAMERRRWGGQRPSGTGRAGVAAWMLCAMKPWKQRSGM